MRAPMNLNARTTSTAISAAMNNTPSGRVSAQTSETKASAPSASPNVGATKNRYWRHRGGEHPHYGSRRVRKPAS